MKQDRATMISISTRFLSLLTVGFLLTASSAVAQVPASAPVATCTAGSSITVPVTVGDLTGLDVRAFGITLEFDSEVIALTGVDKSGTISAPMSVVANPRETDLVVSAGGTSALSGAGTLINVEADCLVDGTSPLTWARFRFNEGEPAVTATSGSITVGEEGEVINIQITPSSLDFGEVIVDSREELTLTIVNTAGANAALEGSVSISGGDFTIEQGGDVAVQPGQSQNVVIAFEPSEEGERTAEVTITHNATDGSAPATIAVSGTGVAAEAVAEISTTSLDLGEVIVFREGSSTLSIENTGNAPLTGSAEITGDDAASFELSEGAGDFTIEAGASLDLTVTFAPETPGPKSAELQITHDAANVGSPIVVSLSAVALDNVSAERTDEMPTTYRLAQNFPNPFNPQTNITFGLPASEHVRISVYDLSGRERGVLVDGVLPAGWHTVEFDASLLPSGTYLYRLQADGQTETRKMTLLK